MKMQYEYSADAALKVATANAAYAPRAGTPIGPGPHTIASVPGVGWTTVAAATMAASNDGSAVGVFVDEAASLVALTGAVAPGKQRKLVLVIGESGAAGQGSTADVLPVGYPPADSSVWKLDMSYRWAAMAEPTHVAGKNPVEVGTFSASAGVSFAGVFAWQLQRLLGSGYETGLICCGQPGAQSSAWLPSQVRTSLYAATIARTKSALAMPNTSLDCILLDQGINDAVYGTQAGLASRWRAILASMYSDLSLSADVPLYFKRQCATMSTYPGVTIGSWSSMLGELDALASNSPSRVLVASPEGPWIEATKVHLTTSAQIELAQRLMDVRAARGNS